MRCLTLCILHAWLATFTPTARAALDVYDGGPSLKCGAFEMRVTNAGILGNAFLDRSFDPSFEFPQGSGQEMMNHAALWVGARTDDGFFVSGGPLLEWRPTPDSTDKVVSGWHGRLGARRMVDDDEDGRLDEELLDGLDNDGDGEIDEDLGFQGQQVLAAKYTDDRPEAVQYLYPNGEQHTPLHLSVRQEVFGWSAPGYDGIAGIEYTITNHGDRTLRDVRVGLLADLDARVRDDPLGHSDDLIQHIDGRRQHFDGSTLLTVLRRDTVMYSCSKTLGHTVPVVRDRNDGRPCVAVVGLGHPIDPMAQIVTETDVSPALAIAPARESFVYSVFGKGRSAGSGGLPLTDDQRYDALAGRLATAAETIADDYVVLVACGPFRVLAPGKSLSVRFALVAAADPDTMGEMLGNAFETEYGAWINLEPDTTGQWTSEWNLGRSGINGHEVCLAAPANARFQLDPHCGRIIPPEGAPAIQRVYTPDQCIWTDADCNKCTGFNGNETHMRWRDPGAMPPPPTVRVVPGDNAMRVEWDNMPEILVGQGLAGPDRGTFTGYSVYRISDWRGRRSPLPSRDVYALMGSFGSDVLAGHRPLAQITDTTLDYIDIAYERPRYGPGRYVFTDTSAFNGHDYVYIVTTLVDRPITIGGYAVSSERFESPRVASFADARRPRVEAGSKAGVWVVPNPFRGSSGWDRAPVYGDRLTRHLDFMGLPRERCTIRIWTVAGDLVQTIDHDGTNGDGQAAWNLVTRNGQEAESGIYLFSVHSSKGIERGRFVVVR